MEPTTGSSEPGAAAPGNVTESQMTPPISKDRLVSWLNDAYAMEQAISKVLENHVNDAKDYPLLQTQLQKHLEQTRHHGEIVKGCIERLGASTSAIKSGLADISGILVALSTGMAQDELVKNAIADYATEHFEIASYTALITAARDYGDADIVRACESIRQDEQEMAQWLEQRLPIIVQNSLRKAAQSGQTDEQGKSLLENPVVEAGLAAGAVGAAAFAAKKIMEGQSKEGNVQEGTQKEQGLPESEVSKLRPGMTMSGSDGLSFGHVIRVDLHGKTLVIERPGGNEFEMFVPFSAIQSISDDTITVDVPSTEITEQPWDRVTISTGNEG